MGAQALRLAECNRRWAERVLAHAVQHRPSPLDPARLKLRIFAMECMVDDILREIFVIRNPDIIAAAADREALIQELSAIWFKALYEAD